MILRELINKFGFQIDDKALKDAERRFESAQKKFRKIGDSATSLGKSWSLKLTAPLSLMGFGFLRAFDKQEKAVSQVRAGLIATSNTAGRTLEQLKKQASELQDQTIFGDEEILSGATAQLLTFTNIAGDQFDRTQKAVLDVATRLAATKGGAVDLTSTAIQLGKALNDPVANLGALGRSGIQFSDAQKELIKTLFQTGRQAEAQNVILTELEKQYGGSAEAAAKAGTGGIKQLSNQIGDLAEDFGVILYEFLMPLIKELKSLVKWLRSTSKTTKTIIVVIGIFAAALGPLLIIFGQMAIGISFMLPLLAKMAVAFKFMGNSALFAQAKLLLIPLAIAAVIAAIYLIVDDIRGFLSGKKSVFGQLVIALESAFNVLGDKFKSFGTIARSAIAVVLTPLRLMIATIKTAAGLMDVLRGKSDFSKFLSNTGENLRGVFDITKANNSLGEAMGFSSDMNPMTGLANRARENVSKNSTNVNQNATLNVNVQGLPPELAKETAQQSMTDALGSILRDTARSARPAIER